MKWPLMQKNIVEDDVWALRGFIRNSDGQLDGPIPRLTQGPQVAAFEREFADWLGVKYAVMVNSGASANLLTMAALRELKGVGEVIVPAVTWSSDIASVLHAGMTPVFVDVDPRTFGADWRDICRKITPQTLAVFATHCLGFCCIPPDVALVEGMPIWIEDCCESIGAYRPGDISDPLGRKLGTLGLASNFSFYYGHHMTTIEGGMICTNDEAMYETCRVLRSHGMIREISSEHTRRSYEDASPGCWPDFTFDIAGYNVRSTEINAVIGRSQLKRLDANISKRTENLILFLSLLDGDLYRTDYRTEGSSNFALPLVLKDPDDLLMGRVTALLADEGVEFRRGTAGGGNQLRQPYLRKRFAGDCRYNPLAFPNAEHIHEYGLYIGNYPGLQEGMIRGLCYSLNELGHQRAMRPILMDESCGTQAIG